MRAAVTCSLITVTQERCRFTAAAGAVGSPDQVLAMSQTDRGEWMDVEAYDVGSDEATGTAGEETVVYSSSDIIPYSTTRHA